MFFLLLNEKVSMLVVYLLNDNYRSKQTSRSIKYNWGLPLTLYFYWKEIFFTEKRTEISEEDSAQKIDKKVHKNLFYFTDINVFNNSVLLFYFFGI